MVETSKFQAPSSRETSNSKLQTARIPVHSALDVWCFSGAWTLVLGASLVLLPHRNDDRANQRCRQQEPDHLQRQNKFRHQVVADLFNGGRRSEEHTSELQSPCNL